MKVAIIGGGGVGLTTAWLLDGSHAVTLYEKQDRLGGHAHTITLDLEGTHRSTCDYYPHGCPCGYAGDPTRACTCSAGSIARYQKRISGPLLDRIDIHVEVRG